MAFLLGATLSSVGTANAASGTWSGSGLNGNWSNASNWISDSIPGTTDPLIFLNGDTASFSTTSSNNHVIVDASRNLKFINFETANVGSYTFDATNGSVLRMGRDAIIRILSTAGANLTQTFNVPIILEPLSNTVGSTINFQNLSTHATTTLNFTGSISGGKTTGTVTLSLGGQGNSGANTVSGSISDGEAAHVALVKTNTTQWTLSGSNSFTGGLLLEGGTLNINNEAALGTGTFTLRTTNPSFDNTSGRAITLTTNNAQSWGPMVRFLGTNDLNLGTGTVAIDHATTEIRTTTVGSNLTVAGVIEDGVGTSLLKSAWGGTLTLSGSNTFTGGFTLGGGVLNIDNSRALGTGTFTISANGVTIGNTSGDAIIVAGNTQVWNGNFGFQGPYDLNLGTGNVTFSAARTVTVSAATLTVDGNINGGANTFTKAGNGVLVLGGSNTFGTTTVTGGVLRLGHANALTGGIGAAGGSANLTLNGGVIELTSASGDFNRALGTGVGAVQIGANGGGFSAYGVDRVVNLGGAGGVLSWGLTGFAATAKLMLSSSEATAMVDLQNAIDLRSSSARTIEVADGSADVDAQMSGVISNSTSGNVGGIIKTGSGTLLMTGNSTYRGSTTINGGRVVVGSASALGSSAVSVSTAATLEVKSGVAGFANTVELNGGTLLYNGTGAYAANNVIFNSGVLKGKGPFNGYLNLTSVNQVLAPGSELGHGPGIMTFSGSDRNWSGFTYSWDLKNFEGTTAGTDFSRIDIDGILDLDAEGHYVLTLSSVLGNSLGNVANFSETDRSWTILTATDGIFGFTENTWFIDTSGFTSTGGWTGTWSLGLSGDETGLVLNYAAVPEPSSMAFIGGGLVVLIGALRRNRGRAV